MTASRHTALRVLFRIPLPALAVPQVLGIDDFAVRRGSVYTTVLIDAGTGRRVDVVPGRTADVAVKWLRDHPGVEVVCQDGSGAYGEAVRQAMPDAVQVSDLWHLWHGLGEAIRKEVAAHAACWAKGMSLQEGKRAATTLEGSQQVRELCARNVGLLECARRLSSRSPPSSAMTAPANRSGCSSSRSTVPPLSTPRDYLRKRGAEEPGVPVRHLLREIRELGYLGSSNLLDRCINQGRVKRDRPHLSPRRAAWILLTRPGRLAADSDDLQSEVLQFVQQGCGASSRCRTGAGIRRAGLG
jgi:hypothetical protein